MKRSLFLTTAGTGLAVSAIPGGAATLIRPGAARVTRLAPTLAPYRDRDLVHQYANGEMAELMAATGCTFVIERGRKTYLPPHLGGIVMPNMKMSCDPFKQQCSDDPPPSDPEIYNAVLFTPPSTGLRIIAHTSTRMSPINAYYDNKNGINGPVYAHQPKPVSTNCLIGAISNATGVALSFVQTMRANPVKYGAIAMRFVAQYEGALLTPGEFLAAVGATLLSPEILGLLVAAAFSVGAYYVWRLCFE